jgi:hypothetical protein
MKLKFFFLFFLAIVILTGCIDKSNESINKEPPSTSETVTANIEFRASAGHSQDSASVSNPAAPLPGVVILLIGTDGKVIDKLIANEQGIACKDITVPVDHKYLDEHAGAGALDPRGIVPPVVKTHFL